MSSDSALPGVLARSSDLPSQPVVSEKGAVFDESACDSRPENTAERVSAAGRRVEQFDANQRISWAVGL